jgi:3-ketosteroid 9alpha-monooxygenase subunit B
MNDRIEVGSTLLVVPPVGLFVLNESDRKLVLFAGGSGITPMLSIIKSALEISQRSMTLIYANRDERSIIFKAELEALQSAHPGRLEIRHNLDAVDGFLDRAGILSHVGDDTNSDFYLCGPGPFMTLVEEALVELKIDDNQIHIERFVSPPDPHVKRDAAKPEVSDESVPAEITVVLEGQEHNIPYPKGEKILLAARGAGLDPPFSCEDGFCSCCMAKLIAGKITMDDNNCLSQRQLDEGWILTCQARCTSGKVKVEYPD